MAKKKKQEEIKVRVTDEMKRAILDQASAREESESLIVREAIAEYLATRKIVASSPVHEPTQGAAPPAKRPRKSELRSGAGPASAISKSA